MFKFIATLVIPYRINRAARLLRVHLIHLMGTVNRGLTPEQHLFEALPRQTPAPN